MMPYKETVYAVNGNAGAVVAIPVTYSGGGIRRMTIVECPDPANPAAFAAQGLVYQTFDDKFVASKTLVPAEELDIRHEMAQFQGRGATIGCPALPMPNGNNRAADTIVKLLSATATGTKVRVREYA